MKIPAEVDNNMKNRLKVEKIEFRWLYFVLLVLALLGALLQGVLWVAGLVHGEHLLDVCHAVLESNLSSSKLNKYFIIIIIRW